MKKYLVLLNALMNFISKKKYYTSCRQSSLVKTQQNTTATTPEKPSIFDIIFVISISEKYTRNQIQLSGMKIKYL